jgi:hypothetical protein
MRPRQSKSLNYEFVGLERVLAVVAPAVFERGREYYEVYHAFADPSGGSGDSMTLCIGHKDVASKQIIVDAIRETKPPFSPEAVCAEFALLCKAYGISKIVGDRYAGEWPKEAFSKHGIRYEQSAKPKSDLYLDLLAAINSKRISLYEREPTNPMILNNIKLLNDSYRFIGRSPDAL